MQKLARYLGWLLGLILLGALFAQVEIQIEGAAGWAKNLPTWRIPANSNIWLKLFWGGREMTGYHAWVFPFIFLVFHFALLFFWQWSWKLEARAMAAPMIFWIAEDYLWFAFNPAFGPGRLTPADAPWHPHWFLGVPVDYWVFGVTGLLLLWWSFDGWGLRPADAAPGRQPR